MTLFLDVAPTAGNIAIFAGAAFFLVFLAVAFVVYRILKKSVTMAFRIVIVALILAVAAAGSVFLFAVGSSKPPRPTPRTAANR